MPTPETLTTFFIAALVLGLAPGPDNLYVLSQSALHGRSAGFTITLGLCTGLLGHTAAVTLGLATLLAASATAFTILKFLGAAYLFWLAWQAFRASAATLQSAAVTAASKLQLYRRGLLMNISNPKVSIFFLAFLPQFVDPARGGLTGQLLALGGIFIIATLLVFGGIALLAGMLGGWLARSPGVQRLMNRLAGTVFVALALRLIVSQR